MGRRRSRTKARAAWWATAGGVAAGAALLGSLLGGVTVSAMDPHYRYAAETRAERERFRAFRTPEPTRPAEAVYSPIPRWDEWAGPSEAGVAAWAEKRGDGHDDPALLGPARDWEADSRRYAEEARAEIKALEARIAREEARREAVEAPIVAVPAPPVPVMEVAPAGSLPPETAVRPTPHS